MENNMTAANLRSAFGGESMAYQRYKIWGEIAKDEGFPDVGRLFEAIADAEKIHASNHFKTMKDVEGDFLVPSMAGFGIGKTSMNLAKAISGENFEITQMYATYIAAADFQKENEAKKSFTWAIESEKEHSKLYTEAKKSVDSGKDYQIDKIEICSVCGYTVVGEAPQKCPICGAAKDKFIAY